MFNFIMNYIDKCRQVSADITNRKLFKENIFEEMNNKESDWNRYHLNIDNDYKFISMVVDIPVNFQLSGTDNDINNKLKEMVRPVTNYLGIGLGWSEYLYAPDFYHIEDPSDDSDSLTYLVIWNYMPIVIHEPSFWIETLFYAALFVGIVLGIVKLLALL